MGEYTNPVWEKTNDELGILPKEPIICPICYVKHLNKAIQEGRDLKTVEPTRMFLRRSRLHQVPDVRLTLGTTEHRPWAFDTFYKCSQCDFFCVFGVPTDLEYAQATQEKRKGDKDYLVPVEMWEEEEEVKKRLKALGYV